MVDHCGGVREVSAGCHVASSEGEREGVSATGAGDEQLHILLAQCGIDGLNGGQTRPAELATTHRSRCYSADG